VIYYCTISVFHGELPRSYGSYVLRFPFVPFVGLVIGDDEIHAVTTKVRWDVGDERFHIQVLSEADPTQILSYIRKESGFQPEGS
jgi:hypothetical protein